MCILYNTGGCPFQLALPISPKIMDVFWCSRCLNDHIEVPDIVILFAGGTTIPLVMKIWTKQPWMKIENLHNFDRNFAVCRGKIWLWLFYIFLHYGYNILDKKFQVISSKNEGVTLIFKIQNQIKIQKNRRQIFILLEMSQNFSCRILKP